MDGSWHMILRRVGDFFVLFDGWDSYVWSGSVFRSDNALDVLPIVTGASVYEVFFYLALILPSFFLISFFLFSWVIQGRPSFGFDNWCGIYSMNCWFNMCLSKSCICVKHLVFKRFYFVFNAVPVRFLIQRYFSWLLFQYLRHNFKL